MKTTGRGRILVGATPPPSGGYPNLPGLGWTPLGEGERPFLARNEQGWVDFSWKNGLNGAPDVPPTIENDGTAPGGASFIRAHWLQGWANVGSGADFTKSSIPTGMKEMYVHFFNRFSLDFAMNGIVHKTLYPYRRTATSTGGSFSAGFKLTQGISANPQTGTIEPEMQAQSPVAPSPNLHANLNTVQRFIQRGQWHRLEFYVKQNTPGQLDGLFKMWKDGVLIMDYANVGYSAAPDPGEWASFRLSLYAGGNATGTVPADQYQDVARLFVAYR